MNAQPLEGRTAIVTGSAQGIGKAIVKRFVDEGARVAIVDVDMDQAQKAAEEIGAVAFCSDVTDGEAVNRTFAEIVAGNGGAPAFNL